MAVADYFQQGEQYHENDTRSIPVDVDFEEETLQITSPLLACDLMDAPDKVESS